GLRADDRAPRLRDRLQRHDVRARPVEHGVHLGLLAEVPPDDLAEPPGDLVVAVGGLVPVVAGGQRGEDLGMDARLVVAGEPARCGLDVVGAVLGRRIGHAPILPDCARTRWPDGSGAALPRVDGFASAAAVASVGRWAALAGPERGGRFEPGPAGWDGAR